ncbi:hypothetical protein OAK35_04235 [Crocinitomicaceae bacterium]|nr:hypothetical protein [Crocinitomicaceae bacterium]
MNDYFPQGNWKRYVEQNGNSTANHYESKLEEFRLEVSPESKSRETGLFAFQNLNDAESYGRFNRDADHHIYELETKSFSIHNYEITSFLMKFIKTNDIKMIERNYTLMRMYWLDLDEDLYYGTNISVVPELIIDQPALITKVIY